MSGKRPRARAILIAVLLLSALGWAGVQIYLGAATRSVWCRLVDCPDLEHLDELCRLFAEVELVKPDASPDDRRRWVASEASAPAARYIQELDDYESLLDDATDAGGRNWSCPAIERDLASR